MNESPLTSVELLQMVLLADHHEDGHFWLYCLKHPPDNVKAVVSIRKALKALDEV